MSVNAILMRAVVGLGLAACLSAGAWAQAGVEPAAGATASPPASPVSADDLSFANRLSKVFKSVASQAEPAVVHITAYQKRQQVRYDWFGMPVERGPVSMQQTSLGSGFIVNTDGTVMTNNHVVADADELRVRLADGREMPAKVVGRDEATDLAVLRIDTGGKRLDVRPAVLGDSDAMDVGEWVVAIGSPFGFSRTVTAGIVSAKGRSLTPRETGHTYEDFIQTDAAINPGNSGGPLLNLRGEVVGINSAIASRTGGYEGLGFAIPSNVARIVMDNILANGRVVRGYLGLSLADATPEQLGDTHVNGDAYRGVYVGGVEEDSPAERAGLKDGDIITRFQGQPVNEARLRTAIAVTRPGTRTELEILRGGKKQTLAATIGDYAAVLADRANTQGAVFIDDLGATIRTYTRQMARDDGYRDARVRGVQVVDVKPGSPAERTGLAKGDIIVEVGGAAMTSASSFVEKAGGGGLQAGTLLGVVRGNRLGNLRVAR
jgi:serine protease Do